MKLKIKVITKLKTKEALAKIREASKGAMRDVVTDIANDAIKGSPVDTGHNKRSIKYEAQELTGSVYSTSGYGGYLETGTVKMPARPYFKPALDRNIHKLPEGIKSKLGVGR